MSRWQVFLLGLSSEEDNAKCQINSELMQLLITKSSFNDVFVYILLNIWRQACLRAQVAELVAGFLERDVIDVVNVVLIFAKN